MGDGLNLEFPPPLQTIEARHAISEHAGKLEIQPNAMCLVFCVEGNLEIGTGEKRTKLSAHEAFLIDAESGAPVSVSHGPSTDFYLIRFRQVSVPKGPPGERLVVPSSVVPGSSRLTHLLHMCVEKSCDAKASRLVLHHLLILALCELVRSSQEGAAEPTGDGCFESVASHVDAFIAAHYHEAIGTLEIARQLRYNPYYLERAYRQERHVSIREAIHERRIREACAQLRLSGKRGVAEIAALCGNNDTGYFRRDFKRATHMTPHGYRVVSDAHAPLVPVKPAV
jgi:AraC-like DNA-binding protein